MSVCVCVSVCVHTMTLTLTNMLASFEASRNDLCGTQFPVAHAPRYFLLVEGLLVIRWVNDGAGGTWSVLTPPPLVF